MKIVIDTNILHKDFLLGKAQIISLCETAKKCGMQVFVPQVVIDEVVNHYREEIDKAKGLLDKAQESLKLFYPNECITDYISHEKAVLLLNNYQQSLDRRLEELNIKIIPYPTIRHEEVVRRDLARRRPFQESGKGYRDALIWESILNIIEDTDNDPDVVFINKNTKDFFEKDNLHPDLKKDIENKGLSPHSIEIFNDISKAINKHIKPRQESLDLLKNDYAGMDCIGSIVLKNYVFENLEPDIFSGLIEDIPFFLSGPGSYMEEPEFYGITDCSCSITDIRLLNDNQIIVDVDASLEIEYSAFLHKADSYLISDEDMPNIMNDNWNKHYMLVNDTISVPINLSLIIDKNLEAVSSHSVSAKK